MVDAEKGVGVDKGVGVGVDDGWNKKLNSDRDGIRVIIERAQIYLAASWSLR